jgi:hypothetical protein
MFRRRYTLLLAALVAFAWVAGGCDNNATNPGGSTTTESPNLNDPTGGYKALDAQPGFGDPALIGSGSAEATVVDPLETSDAQMANWASLPDSVHAYSVSLLWGTLRKDPAVSLGAGDSGIGIVTDWSGYAAVNRGALVVRSATAFDLQDHLVQPRADRRKIEWISHTTDAFDGVRFWVYQPFPPGVDGSGDSLTIVAGTHTWTFLVNELADTDSTYVVDQSGNRFSIKAFRIQPGSCVRGFLGGVWLPASNTGENGRIRGRVLDNRGVVLGHVQGIFGTSNLGSKVFFAKYVDRDGTFKGILRGTWSSHGLEVGEVGPSSSGEKGVFHGVIIDASLNTIGAVHGQWHARTDNTDGTFDGFWSTGCTN